MRQPTSAKYSGMTDANEVVDTGASHRFSWRSRATVLPARNAAKIMLAPVAYAHARYPAANATAGTLRLAISAGTTRRANANSNRLAAISNIAPDKGVPNAPALAIATAIESTVHNPMSSSTATLRTIRANRDASIPRSWKMREITGIEVTAVAIPTTSTNATLLLAWPMKLDESRNV